MWIHEYSVEITMTVRAELSGDDEERAQFLKHFVESSSLLKPSRFQKGGFVDYFRLTGPDKVLHVQEGVFVMAAGSLPAPGSEMGPCLDENCGHRDCKATREMAAQDCTICGGIIGYNARFFRDNDGGEQHEKCFLEALEKERAKEQDQ